MTPASPARLARRAAYRAPEGVVVAVAAALVPSVLALATVGLPAWASAVVAAVGLAAGTAWVVARVREDRDAGVEPPPALASWAPWGLVAAAGAWLWVTHAEWVDINRDPGFLITSARLLQLGQGVPLDLAPADLVEAVPGVMTVAGPALGEGPTPGTAYVQGAPGLPLLLATVGRLTDPGTFPVHAGPVLSALSLLGVVLLARAVLGNRALSLLPPLVLAVSLPWLYVARATFTEPVTLLLTLGGLALVADGLVAGRLPSILTGATAAGLAGLVRVDAVLLGAVPVVLLLAVALLTGLLPATRWRWAAAAAVAAVGTAGLGVLVTSWSSPKYLADLTREMVLGWAATAVTLVALAVAVLLARRGARAPVAGPSWWRRWLPRLLPALGLLLLAYQGSRVFWDTARGIPADSPYAYAIERLQRYEGLALDGTRTYDELTVASVAWYFGLGALLLAAVALVCLSVRGSASWDRRPRWAVGSTVLVVALLVQEAVYLRSWSITPDQLWASRRLVVGAYPLLVLAATVGIAAAVTWASGLGHASGGRAGRVLGGMAAAVGVGVLVLPAWLASGPFLGQGAHVGMVGVLDKTCQGIHAEAEMRTGDPDARPVVVVSAVRERLITPLATACGLPVVRTRFGVSPARVVQWAQAAEAQGYTPVAVVDSSVAQRFPEVVDSVPVYQRRIEGPPRAVQRLYWRLSLLPVDGRTAPMLDINPET
ncbi:MAG: hypothetical protein R2737_02675 [Candidatus Nanopelagicales bacterium]